MTTNFISPLSFVAVLGSGILDGYKSGSGIRVKHPGSATLYSFQIPIFPSWIRISDLDRQTLDYSHKVYFLGHLTVHSFIFCSVADLDPGRFFSGSQIPDPERDQGFEMEKERKNFQKMCKIGIRPVIGLPDPDF